jgi:N-acetylglucosaminyldiphosphoundecaprenol N-acetyl-beta-D-mannosaminyltransferase
MNSNCIKIFGVKINKLTNEGFLNLISHAITNRLKITIAYANAHTLNQCHSNIALAELLNSMDYIHPDGVGVFWASKKLYGKSGLNERITGSDFYPLLINECIRNDWSIFFFGHRNATLEKISQLHPNLRIAGTAEGYDYDNDEVIQKINESRPDILIIGLSFPLQEKWMREFKEMIDCRVLLAVGEGIKVFSGEKKRGPVLLRKFGLEWLVRVVSNPASNLNRYLTGNPQFVTRVIMQKKGQN